MRIGDRTGTALETQLWDAGGGRLAFPFAINKTVISCSVPQCPSLVWHHYHHSLPLHLLPFMGLGVGFQAKCEDGPDKQSDWEETHREGDPDGQDVRGRRETVGMEGKTEGHRLGDRQLSMDRYDTNPNA